MVGFEKRREVSIRAMTLASETRDKMAAAGFDMSLFSGGSTGTYNIDTGDPGVTELQVGSYVFMGVDYRRIGSRSGNKIYDDFQPSLKVLTTVVSANHADRVTLDAGLKALDTTTRSIPQIEGRTELTYSRFGDEFGRVEAKADGRLPALGSRLELIVPHCDPTLNLYGKLHVVRGDRVLEVWPLATRRG